MQQPISLWGAQESKPDKICLKIANELFYNLVVYISFLFFYRYEYDVYNESSCYVIIGQQDEQYHSKFCTFKKHIKYKPPIRN